MANNDPHLRGPVKFYQNTPPCLQHGAPRSKSTNLNFILEAIRKLKPFPQWLHREMRSNHAGETGAVLIYAGAAHALQWRRRVSSSSAFSPYEQQLEEFVQEHQQSEREHLVLLNHLMDQADRSVLLPGWRAAGFMLGFISTLWCPRGMYVTTEAVETFVADHYKFQITKLGGEIRLLQSQDRIEQEARLEGMCELLKLLQHCCEEEVHHQQEAREQAARGPFPWFEAVDTGWRWIVIQGSMAAASLAKRV